MILACIELMLFNVKKKNLFDVLKFNMLNLMSIILSF